MVLGFTGTPQSRQSEDDHGRQPRAAEEARDDARRHGDVLLALQFVADHAAADAAAGVETVEHLAAARVEREKVVVHVAVEEHPTPRPTSPSTQPGLQP